MEACAATSDAPRLAGCCGFPSIFVAFCEQAGGISSHRHRRGEPRRFAWDDFLGLANIGYNLFLWHLHARAETRQRERGAHDFQKLPTADFIVPLRSLRRELAMKELLKSPG